MRRTRGPNTKHLTGAESIRAATLPSHCDRRVFVSGTAGPQRNILHSFFVFFSLFFLFVSLSTLFTAASPSGAQTRRPRLVAPRSFEAPTRTCAESIQGGSCVRMFVFSSQPKKRRSHGGHMFCFVFFLCGPSGTRRFPDQRH